MYYEEKMINGVLMFRTTPSGDWQQCSIEKLSASIVELRANLAIAEKLLDDKSYAYYLECANT